MFILSTAQITIFVTYARLQWNITSSILLPGDNTTRVRQLDRPLARMQQLKLEKGLNETEAESELQLSENSETKEMETIEE